jgi:hypothetical protein
MRNKSKYEPYLMIGDNQLGSGYDREFKNWDTFIDEMSKPDTYIENDVQILACANVLKRNIYIYGDVQKRDVKFNAEDQNKVKNKDYIYLANLGPRIHYQLVSTSAPSSSAVNLLDEDERALQLTLLRSQMGKK